MMGHKICFYGDIWVIIPKLSLLLLLIWRTAPLKNEGPKEVISFLKGRPHSKDPKSFVLKGRKGEVQEFTKVVEKHEGVPIYPNCLPRLSINNS